MAMFSEDKSSRKFSKIGSRLDANFAVSISKLCYSNTFVKWRTEIVSFFAQLTVQLLSI